MPQDQRAAARMMWFVLMANITVAGLKLMLSLLSGSAMLRGDAYFTVIDGLVDLMLLVFMRYAAKPADARHPYGHAKFEALAVAAVSVLIFAALQDLGRHIWEGFQHALAPQAEPWYLWLLAGLLVFNLGLAAWEYVMARRLRSSGLSADAWYTLTGCMLTVLSLGALLGAEHGLAWPDAAGASVAFVLTLGAGFIVARDALAALTDERRLDPQAVEDAARSVEGVLGCHHVRSRGMADSIHVDLHIEVAPQLPVLQAHLLADLVEQAVQERFPDVNDVTVHVEPRMVH
jgi:cation diffusion facilitator family transporter